MRARREVYLFVGPTMATSPRARALARNVRVRQPVKRADIERLVSRRPRPGVLAIVDGLFHDTLSVGHAELREAMRRGWEVWGLSSMGAIRAREMAPLGMRGFGHVYARFEAEGDFHDDEVALLHEPAPGYRAVSEPLVHLRVALDHLAARGIVGAKVARDVAAELKARWYGERTVRRLIESLARGSRIDRAAVEHELEEFDRFRVKAHDLERFLEERPWTESA
jgi:hypothetical protein